jgi:RNA polymerase sigma-70 factor (ECF subfamily)
MDEGSKRPAAFAGQDALLIKAFQGGDRAAFDKLVLRHKDKLFNLCYSFLGDYEEANDSSQEAFIKAYQGLKKFWFESSFSTWLYRIAVNTCTNKVKSLAYRQKKMTSSLDNPGGMGENRAIEIRDEDPTPLMELEEKERQDLIRRAIDQLPPEHKAVVALRDIEGLSYEEIAEITRSNLGTVKSRLSRARIDLRSKLRSIL